MARVNRALLSVADKRGIAEFAAALDALDIELISTGGTAQLLRQKGVDVTDVASLTGFPEILDGRFKTLHPFVHCGLLALRDSPDHVSALEQHGIPAIDLVVVNLAPFERVAARADCTVEEAIETIDIGGAALLRSGAKNHRFVGVVCDPDDYERVLQELRNGRELSASLRAELGLKAFRTTSRYDRAVAAYLASNIEGRFPAQLSLDFTRVQELRYGENPHQAAAFYRDTHVNEPSAGTAVVLGGATALSFNNLVDVDVAIELVKEFEGDAAVLVAHGSPCGAAVGESVAEAFERAFACDPRAALGATLAMNRRVDAATAERLVAPPPGGEPKALEVIAAPDFEERALEIIADAPTWGSRARVLRTGAWAGDSYEGRAYDLKRIVGGLLVQDRDVQPADDASHVVTDRQPTDDEWRALRFGYLCAKHARSNAVMIATGKALVGVGAGQMSRADAAALAIQKAGDQARGAVVASDGYFLFPDVVAAVANAGCTAICHPGGGARDQLAIDQANELGLAMVFAGRRHFRH